MAYPEVVYFVNDVPKTRSGKIMRRVIKAKALGNPVGALPFTLVRAPQCGFQAALLGEVDEAKLDKAVAQARQQCGRRR